MTTVHCIPCGWSPSERWLVYLATLGYLGAGRIAPVKPTVGLIVKCPECDRVLDHTFVVDVPGQRLAA